MAIGDPLIDLKKIEALASDSKRMATIILELQKRAKEWKIGTDPNRRASLIARLEMCVGESQSDSEAAHEDADNILLEFINDEQVSHLFGQIRKYYG
jgi:uncharacterized protein YpuA (DUF1002 family)